MPFSKLNTPMGLILFGSQLFTACNIYEVFHRRSEQKAEYYVLEGQKNLQNSRYQDALQHFEQAITLDSSQSQAYLGAAKAHLLINNVNSFIVAAQFQNIENGSIPFLNLDHASKNRLFKANVRAAGQLAQLIHRDTLARSDGIVVTEDVLVDHMIASLLSALLSLLDLNFDNFISLSEDKTFRSLISHQGEFVIDSLPPLTAVLPDVNQFNLLLDRSSGFLQQSSWGISEWVENYISPIEAGAEAYLETCIHERICGISSPRILMESAVQDMGHFLVETGLKIPFYKVADGVDNDGDGCADEEFIDGLDNDGDGLIDEDSRGVPDSLVNPSFLALTDGTDNNGNGQTDEPAEAAFDRRYATSYAQPYASVFPSSRGEIYWEFDRNERGDPVRRDKRQQNTRQKEGGLVPLSPAKTMDLCQGL